MLWGVRQRTVESRNKDHLLMLFSNSDIIFVLLSLVFICFNWRFLRTLAVKVLRGIEMIYKMCISYYQYGGVGHTIIAIPTNAGHPRTLYSDANAKMTWNVPEMRMRP